MFLSDNRQLIRPDFVGGVSVSGDSVSADDGGLHASFSHDLRRHVVTDKRNGNPALHQFPGRQTRALKQRPGFVRVHVNLFPFFRAGETDAQRRAEVRRCQPAGVAVRMNAPAVLNERGTVFPNSAADRPVVRLNLERLRQQLFSNVAWRFLRPSALSDFLHPV